MAIFAVAYLYTSTNFGSIIGQRNAGTDSVCANHGCSSKNTNIHYRIDALGYFNKEMNSSELNHQQDIYLDLNEEVLPELYIIPENAKTRIRTYGQTREGSGKIQGGYSGRYLEEIKLTSEQSDITDNTGITVNTKGLSKVLSAHLHIAGNSYKKASIKIQLYDCK